MTLKSTPDEPNDVSNISVVTEEDRLEFIPQIDRKYVILGMLCEYGGRSIMQNSSVVEGFFVDEIKQARIFFEQLLLFAEEESIDASIELIENSSGHSSVVSKELSEIVNGWYAETFVGDSRYFTIDGEERKVMQQGIRSDMFPKMIGAGYTHELVDSRFSYLHGCYLRYGTDDTIRIANAEHQVKLIIQLIDELRFDWVQWHKDLKRIPQTHRITFGGDEYKRKVFHLGES